MFGLPRFLKCTLLEFCPLGCNANCFFELFFFFFLLEQAAEVRFNYIDHQTTSVPRSPLTYCNILSHQMEKKKNLKQNHPDHPLEMVFGFWTPPPGWNQLGYNSNWGFSPKVSFLSVIIVYYQSGGCLARLLYVQDILISFGLTCVNSSKEWKCIGGGGNLLSRLIYDRSHARCTRKGVLGLITGAGCLICLGEYLAIFQICCRSFICHLRFMQTFSERNLMR